MPKPYMIVPVAVQAMQFTMERVDDLATWTGGVVVEEIDPFDPTQRTTGMNIVTRHGVERFALGDWAVKESPTGKFSRVPDEDFQKYFRPVEGWPYDG